MIISIYNLKSSTEIVKLGFAANEMWIPWIENNELPCKWDRIEFDHRVLLVPLESTSAILIHYHFVEDLQPIAELYPEVLKGAHHELL
jgi:hypothetical protein